MLNLASYCYACEDTILCVCDFYVKKTKCACLKVKVAQSCPTLFDPMDPIPYSPWNSPGQNTGVGSLSLLQGIFPTQGSNPGLLHCRRILYQLSHKGHLRILEWGAYPFSNWGLLHCRCILYQLNYQGSPVCMLGRSQF